MKRSIALFLMVLLVGCSGIEAKRVRGPGADTKPTVAEESDSIEPEGEEEVAQIESESQVDNEASEGTESSSDEESASNESKWIDSDGDGFGQTTKDGEPVDCNDTSADLDGDGQPDGYAINPGAKEVCDGIDNDCDGEIDEGLKVQELYRDADGDKWGAGELVSVCDISGYVESAGDCNDNDPDIHPYAEDPSGDGIDQNCDDASASAQGEEPENEEEYEEADATTGSDASEDSAADVMEGDEDASVEAKEDAGAASDEEDAEQVEADSDEQVSVEEEVDNDPIDHMATLTVEVPVPSDLALTVELAQTEEKIGTIGWGEVPVAKASDSETIASTFSIAGQTFVRLQVTIGQNTWLCMGNGPTATILSGVSTELNLSDDYEIVDCFVWSDPNGAGCSLVYEVALADEQQAQEEEAEGEGTEATQEGTESEEAEGTESEEIEEETVDEEVVEGTESESKVDEESEPQADEEVAEEPVEETTEEVVDEAGEEASVEDNADEGTESEPSPDEVEVSETEAEGTEVAATEPEPETETEAVGTEPETENEPEVEPEDDVSDDVADEPEPEEETITVEQVVAEEEVDNDPIDHIALLTVEVADHVALTLNIERSAAEQDIGKYGWEPSLTAQEEENDTIVQTFSIEGMTFVRTQVTVGVDAPAWLCMGSGDTADLLEGATATLKVSSDYEVVGWFLWSDPEGAGCSLVFEVAPKS